MSIITHTIRWADNTAALTRNLRDGLDQIEATRASADRMIQSLGGDKLIGAAHRYAAAVQEIGGVSSLTAAEQVKVNAVVQKAIEKYEALGKTAPAALKDLAAATSQTGKEWADFAKGFKVDEAINQPLGTAKNAVNAFASTLEPAAVAGLATAASLAAIGVAAFELADRAAKVGTELDDMADKTGLSVPALSKLSNAAQVAGSDLGTMSSALFKFEQGLGEGSKKFEEGLKRLGLSVDEVKRTNPDEWLKLIADRLSGLDDPADRAAATMALFGKQGRDLLPVLLDLHKGFALTQDIEPWTAEQAKEAEAFEMQMKAAKIHVEAFALALGRDLIPVVTALIGPVKSLGNAVWIATGVPALFDAVAGAVRVTSAAVDVLLGRIQEIPKVSGDAARGVKAWKDALNERAAGPLTLSDADQKAAERDLADQLKERQRLQKEAEAAAKKYAEALEHIREAEGGYATALRDVGPVLAAQIQAELKEGAAVADLAEKYHVHAGTVEQLAKQLKFVEAVTEATTKAFHNQLAMMTPLTAAYGSLHDAIGNLAGTWNTFHDGITVAGDEMRTVTIPMFSTLPNVVPQGTKAIAEATKQNYSFASSLKAIFSGNLGGGFTGLFQSLKGSLNFGNILNSMIGSGLSGLVSGGLSLALKGVTSLVSKLFGGASAEELKGRAAVQDFEAQLAKTLTATQKAEAGGQSWKMTVIGVRDAYLATGHSAAEADAAVKRLWDSSKKSEEEQKAAQKAITDVMDQQKKLADTLQKSLSDVASGMNAISKGTVGALNESAAAIDKTKDGSEQAFKKIATTGKAEFDRTGRLAVTAFAAATSSGKTFGEAMDELGPTFDDLTKAQGTFGFTTTESLQELLNFKSFASGPGKEVMSTLDGVNKMMSGLKTLGLLTQSDFNDLSAIATDTFSKMTAGGVSGTQAMRAMQPTLQKIWELHHDQGLEIDDNTKKLLDQAQDAGLVGDKLRDPQERMLSVLERIAKALGADLPEAADKGAKGVKDAIDKVPKKVGVAFEGTFTPPDIPAGGGGGGRGEGASTGGLVTARGIQHFDLGGLVKASGWRMPWTLKPIGTDSVPAMLTPGELVVNQPQQAMLADLLTKSAQLATGVIAGGAKAGAVLQDVLNVTFNVSTIDATNFDQVCEKQVMPRLTSMIEDRRRGYTARWQQALGTT